MDESHDSQDGFDFTCPHCGMDLKGFQEKCPNCGSDLTTTYSAAYHPGTPTRVRVVAWVILGLIGALGLLLAGYGISRLF